MKIQTTLIRQGGTIADIDGIAYHFEPLDDGAHVADVTREDHIDRFLSIAEGYKVYHGKLDPKGKPQKLVERAVVAPVEAPQAKPHQLAGSALHAPYYDIHGRSVPIMEVIEKAFEASGMTPDEWNFLDEEDRAARMDIILDELDDAGPQETAAAGGEDLEALAAQYEAKFGKKPHHSMKTATIKAKLEGA